MNKKWKRKFKKLSKKVDNLEADLAWHGVEAGNPPIDWRLNVIEDHMRTDCRPGSNVPEISFTAEAEVKPQPGGDVTSERAALIASLGNDLITHALPVDTAQGYRDRIVQQRAELVGQFIGAISPDWQRDDDLCRAGELLGLLAPQAEEG